LRQGDHAAARALCHETLLIANEVRESIRFDNRIARCLTVLAAVAANASQPAQALFLFGAASALWQDVSGSLFDRYIRETWEPRAWAAIDHETGARAFAAGRELPAAKAYAVRARGE